MKNETSSANVLLLQRTPYFDDLVSKLFPLTLINIVGISVSSEIQKKALLQQYPDLSVFTDYDITNWSTSFVSQDDITKNYRSQLKVEHHLERWYDCSSYILSIYYSSLAFWLNYFENNVINCIIVRDLEHGTPVESIPMDLAVKNNIPVFIFEPILGKQNTMLWNIRCYNNQKYINIKELDSSQIDISINNYLFTHKYENIAENAIDGKYSSLSNEYSSLSGLFRLRNKFLSENNFTMGYAAYRIISNLLNIKLLKFFYQHHASKKIPDLEPYILYAMHFEPEATILNRTKYNSQIYNIKMLSKYYMLRIIQINLIYLNQLN